MKARDENRISLEVFACGVDHVRDAYGHVYRLTERTTTHETWTRSVAGEGQADLIVTERCAGAACERGQTPGAALFNGDHVERCDECERFADDDDAAIAYVAGLNREAGRLHFVVTYARVRGPAAPMPCVALARDMVGRRPGAGAARILVAAEIAAELARLRGAS